MGWNIAGNERFHCINWSDINSTIVKINYDVQSTMKIAGKVYHTLLSKFTKLVPWKTMFVAA